MYYKTTESLLAFIKKSPTAFQATAEMEKKFAENGYQLLSEQEYWKLQPGGKYIVTRNHSALIAFSIPKKECRKFHIIASHSDSPTWRIKQLDGGKDAVFAKAETEGYGGMIMPTWLDRPLSVAGRILVRTENGIRSLLVHPDRALAVIPNLCIHFNRDLNNGMKYNPQVDLQPIFGEAGSTLRDALAEEAGVKAEDIVDADLVLCTREKAERVGLKGEYFMSGRIDDLECAYTTLWGFLQGRGEEEGRGDMWVMFDNEEVGSATKQGAASTFLRDTLRRISLALGQDEEAFQTTLARSFLVSADNAHAIHPDHPEYADADNCPRMNKGVVIKFNANQHYATDGRSCAVFRAICTDAGVPVQVMANRSDLPGGSTLGCIAGTLVPVSTVDIGLPQLAMHAAWETMGIADCGYLADAMARCFETEL